VAVRTWDLQLDRVAFTYQMRPGNKVLHSLSFAVAEGNVCTLVWPPTNTYHTIPSHPIPSHTIPSLISSHPFSSRLASSRLISGALVGPSGGGKSTVMHLLLRFYDPPDGTICLGGVPYGQLNLRSVHSHIGCVSQETQLFNDTIAGNITYGAPADVSDDDVEAAARAAQAWDFISSFEDGMQVRSLLTPSPPHPLLALSSALSPRPLLALSSALSPHRLSSAHLTAPPSTTPTRGHCARRRRPSVASVASG
jgi:ABC-type multidrug transport system fused ATPase/permease subunit